MSKWDKLGLGIINFNLNLFNVIFVKIKIYINKNKKCGLDDSRDGIQRIFSQYYTHPQPVVNLSLKYQICQ